MKFPIVTIVATSALFALAATAFADPPTREVIPTDQDFVDNTCGFPVRIQAEGTTIRTAYTDKQGRVVRQIEVYPGYRWVLTNVDSGETFSSGIPGPLKLTFNPDGTTTFEGSGPWGWFPTHPSTGETGIFMLHGRITQALDAAGNALTTTFVGRTINICDQLAP